MRCVGILTVAALQAASCSVQCASGPFTWVADRDNDIVTLRNGWSYELNLFSDESFAQQIGSAQVSTSS